jgi:P27 family predicted phage terminase small subunit
MKPTSGMGRGRPPKPTALKILQGGDTRKSRRKNEPKPDVGIPECPEYLDGYARAEWEAVAPILERLRVLTTADRGALELLCRAYAEYREATETVSEDGATYESTNAETGAVIIKAHPAVNQRNDAWRRYRAALADFGLTPSSRAKIAVEPEKPKDPIADWKAKHGRTA